MAKTNYNPKSKSNLKPIKKGEVRNPKGAPKKLPNLDLLLANVLGTENEEGKTAAEQILEALRRRANTGDVKAANLLLERGYGKVKEKIDITTNDQSLNKPSIQIEIITTNGKESGDQQQNDSE